MMTHRQFIAQTYLQNRNYKILTSEEVKRIANDALNQGAFVAGYDSLISLTDDWVQNDECVLEREFYYYSEDKGEYEYAKATALFNEEGIYDFYVVDYDNKEIL